MSVVNTVTQIDSQIMAYTPAVMAGVTAAEASSQSGSNKKQAVLSAIQAGTKVGETIPVPQVAAISGLIDLVVSIFNALGIFKHSLPTQP